MATRATPRCLVLRIVPCCLPQPTMQFRSSPGTIAIGRSLCAAFLYGELD